MLHNLCNAVEVDEVVKFGFVRGLKVLLVKIVTQKAGL